MAINTRNPRYNDTFIHKDYFYSECLQFESIKRTDSELLHDVCCFVCVI